MRKGFNIRTAQIERQLDQVRGIQKITSREEALKVLEKKSAINKFPYFCKELKKDPEIALKAIAQNGLNYEYLDKSLKHNKPFLIKTLNNCPNFLRDIRAYEELDYNLKTIIGGDIYKKYLKKLVIQNFFNQDS